MVKRCRIVGRFSRIVVAATTTIVIMLTTLFVAAEPARSMGGLTLSPAIASPVLSSETAVGSTPAREPFTERYPWLLPAIVVLATALIGLFIASLVQQVRRRLPPPDPPD